ncbi:DUF1573 domain-containing protein [Ulvibacter litoralis]|uniref:DUF1573 domain-containing protein n=1 Tax=Ulvibacter litoralis TaxID=227084 RepID=A0A1G7HQF4_9FLAO|nr:DUF1573 domain-containing protein [Ulvibacter litoralis]GHC58647.1 hypothetical protein GCM10008083_24330 [Ulvibacter litoralis]SDF02528.1 Protein of unknown function [Ulvibacter litoralis]
MVTTVKGSKLFRNVFFIASFLFGTALFAQDAAAEKGVFEFESKVIDYGTIEHNADGVRAFKFKNVGNAPIVITKVKGSCGCTVPTKPNGPIMPGETAEIGVKYATDRIGAFSKTVTVTSNASEATIVLKIKGKVLADTPATSSGL